MLRTIECEAVIFGCRTVEAHPTNKGGAVDPDLLLPAPGIDHVLRRLPPDRWAVLSPIDAASTGDRFALADLPSPQLVVPTSPDRVGDHHRAAERLGADPPFCLALTDQPDGVTAALQAGMKVIGVATSCAPDDLAAADMVIPSLLSLHVVGLHPVLVLEVDAMPGFGTFTPGPQNKRR
jgi:phosphoglycolate phosphatase-like HAD superfamily hydrolase